MPRLVLTGITVGVVPACVAMGCSSSTTDKNPVIALAISSFDAAADAADAVDASFDGTPQVIALAIQSFDAAADTGSVTDASDDGG